MKLKFTILKFFVRQPCSNVTHQLRKLTHLKDDFTTLAMFATKKLTKQNDSYSCYDPGPQILKLT